MIADAASAGPSAPSPVSHEGAVGSTSVGRRRLPTRQPVRALVVVLAYLLVAASGFLVLTGLYGMLGLVLAGFLAAALTVPVAVLAPSPRQRGDGDDPRPVLLRS